MKNSRMIKKLGCLALSSAMILTPAITCLAGPPGGSSSSSFSSGSSSSSTSGGPGSTSYSGGFGGSGGGANTQTFDYSGTYSGTLTADGTTVTSDSEAYSATNTDQNVALAQNGGSLTISNGTLTKSGDSSNDDNCNFYGTNSIVLSVGSSSTVYVSDSSLTSSSKGSNGIFATDSGTVYVNNTTITTTSTNGNARGLDATYGGTIVANEVTISTVGDHSASLATDRGGGNVSVTNSEFSTKGSGSPLLYSTGDIEVDNVTGTASGSQIAGMEGLNSILISNSTLTSTNDAISGSDPIKNGVIIYQSTSGDADTSTGSVAHFGAENSTLKTTISSGAFFYITNTSADVNLTNTVLDYDSDKVGLFTIEGNSSNNWGSAGSNGATVTATLSADTISGNISVDDISSLDLYLIDGTTYTGAATITDNADGSSSSSPITINVGSDSTWVVTEDSTISILNVEAGGQVVDAKGKTVNVVSTSGSTLVDGDSSVIVTVTSYSTSLGSNASGLETASIDRTTFDDTYGTSTSFGSNSTGSTGSSSSSTGAKSKTFTVGNNTYKILTSKTVAFTGVTQDTASVTIPAKVTYKGTSYKVTKIAAKALKNNTAVTSLTIGKNVKSIGKKAFYGTKNLTRIIVKSKKLKASSIGKKAFSKAGSSAESLSVKVPAKKLSAYKKILKKKGLTTSAKIYA